MNSMKRLTAIAALSAGLLIGALPAAAMASAQTGDVHFFDPGHGFHQSEIGPSSHGVGGAGYRDLSEGQQVNPGTERHHEK